MTSHEALRILDASLNRAGEALRVVEDYVRFVLDDAHLTAQLKRLRHDLADAGAALPLLHRHAARDTQHDVGTAVTTPSETQRVDAWDVCIANFERLKQSLRSLEEFSKVGSPDLGARFEALRYRLYTIEAAVGRTVDAAGRLADVKLYVIVDGRESEAAFVGLIESLIVGGVDAIQVRDKELHDNELIARARVLVNLVQKATERVSNSSDQAWSGLAPSTMSTRAPLVIINDRPDVAAIVHADGVHLGQDDMSVKDARAIIGPRKLVGVSTHSLQEARAAVLDGANYIGVGPTFPSQTKAFDDFPGVELLQLVAREIRLPAFAIGGVNANNLSQVVAAGFSRIAVSSAVSNAPDPRSAAQELRELLSPSAAG